MFENFQLHVYHGENKLHFDEMMMMMMMMLSAWYQTNTPELHSASPGD
jgi:hypothetical protein